MASAASTPFSDFYRGKRVLVTGHTGFKGSWLTEWLLELGADVTGFALPPPTTPALFDQLGLASRIRHVIGDVRDLAAVQQAVDAAQPEIVFHLAAQPLVRLSYAEPVDTFATNVMGTVSVLEAVRVAGRPCSVVVVTTDKCYENREWLHGYREEDPLGGHDPYSSSKAAAELVVAAYRKSYFTNSPIRLASARAGNVIGGGDWALDRIVPDCIRALQTHQPIPVRNKVATRPWQHVLEPVSGYLWLAAQMAEGGRGRGRGDGGQEGEARGQRPEDRGQPSKVAGRPESRHSGIPAQDSRLLALSSQLCSAFNFGPQLASNRTVLDLVQEVLKHWPGEWIDRSNANAVHEAGRLNLAIDKAHHVLGWRPVWDFERTLAETVCWYREVAAEPGMAVEVTRRQIAAYSAAAR